MSMNAQQIRQKYLNFFQSKGHVIVPSSSLLPENDPTTLFTGSGMQPMIPYLLGEPHPSGARIADSQKCFRAEDIEEVGDNRHTTFFEMLGNWSLGDYFKKEQIHWMFEFLTKELGLDPKRIYITVFRGSPEFNILRDDETVALWQEEFGKAGIEAKALDFAEKHGMGNGRIFYYPDTKNWWSRAGTPERMPIGEPGGPDSEMFWDFGIQWGLHENSQWKDEPCHVNCGCGRFMEFGNNVFMAYQKKTEKGFVELPKKNIDFGGGLERTAAAVADTPDIFKTILFTPMTRVLEQLSGKQYGSEEQETFAFRVILDHMRGVPFLIADGALPSNKDQGYFTRRLLRRAIRYAHNLGIDAHFARPVAEVVVHEYSGTYPQLNDKASIIFSEIQKEEEQFRKTLQQGEKELRKIFDERAFLNEVQQGASRATREWNDYPVIGKRLFVMYSTYGFPLELSMEIVEEKKRGLQFGGFTENEKEMIKNEFTQEMKKHQELSRAGAEHKFKGGLAGHSEIETRYHTATHLLHKALQMVLGAHAIQKGSNITPERLRFDFAHPEKLSPEEIKRVEDFVNEQIQKDLPVSWNVMPTRQAINEHVTMFFHEKYGPEVKVYSIGEKGKEFSREACGGPHVPRTGVIGKFRIIKEEAVSAGVRRIKAVIQ